MRWAPSESKDSSSAFMGLYPLSKRVKTVCGAGYLGLSLEVAYIGVLGLNVFEHRVLPV